MPAVSVTSTHVGLYAPQLKVNRGCESVGTIIRNRSSHIPTTMQVEAITVPLIVLNRLNANIGTGTRKQQTTIVQNRGENAPLTFDLKTAISEGSLPYHVVRYS